MNNETEQIFLVNASGLQPSVALSKVDVTPAADQGNLESVEDFSMVCRTCATITEFLVPIFSGEGLQNNLIEKIHKHLPIKVTQDDSLPLAVCYQCLHTLLAWHELAACCLQADRALRTRLLQLLAKQNQQSTENENNQVVEVIPQKGFEDIAKFVVPPAENPPAPPSYPAPRTACIYCSTEHTPDQYKEHLIQAHADLLFHCDECDGYVDRKDFILHMSVHVVEYSEAKKKDAPKKRHVKKKKKIKDENENTESNQKSDASEPIQIESVKIDDASKPMQIDLVKINDVSEPTQIELVKTDDASDPIQIESVKIYKPVTNPEINEIAEQTNEFSDHSDTEFDFGPLPDSVFIAIEDSQEIQHGNLCNEPFNEQSNASEFVEVNIIEKGTEEDSTVNRTDIKSTRHREPKQGSGKPKSKVNSVNKQKICRPCPTCGKVYTASSSYFYHIKSCQNVTKDHECQICGKKFRNNSVLIQHMNTHSDNREHECKVCSKRFKSSASLYIHTQNHLGTKKFSCQHCPMTFRWRTHYLRHLKRRHTEDRPHVCKTCGRAFSINWDLQRHIKTHTAGKYTCTECNISYAQERYLKVHVEKKHPQLKAELVNDVRSVTVDTVSDLINENITGNKSLSESNNANNRSKSTPAITVPTVHKSVPISTNVTDQNKLQSMSEAVENELESIHIAVHMSGDELVSTSIVPFERH